MAARKPKVVVTRKPRSGGDADAPTVRHRELNLTRRADDPCPPGRRGSRADVLAPTITDKIDATMLEKAGPKLKLIANFGVGVDHIDVAAANAKGVTVTNTPGVLTEDTADLTMALIMAVARRIVEGANVTTGR